MIACDPKSFSLVALIVANHFIAVCSLSQTNNEGDHGLAILLQCLLHNFTTTSRVSIIVACAPLIFTWNYNLSCSSLQDTRGSTQQ